MAPKYYTLRLQPDQQAEVDAAISIRAEALALRSKASRGAYGPDDLERFWRLIEETQAGLTASNSELAERAGLGKDFFSTVARNQRRPKLPNFLRAVTAIVDTATEHLQDIESNGSRTDEPIGELAPSKLVLLANSLALLARNEIKRLDAERPNDPARLAEYETQRDLLTIFADGFEQISASLTIALNKPEEPLLLGRAKEIADEIGKKVDAWWKKNGDEAVDWCLRIPAMGAGVAGLEVAGANMIVATSAVAAIIGGEKVVKAIKKK